MYSKLLCTRSYFDPCRSKTWKKRLKSPIKIHRVMTEVLYIDNMLALFRDNHFLPLRFGLGLARARVSSPPLLLDALCLFHRPFKLRSLVYRFRHVPTPSRSCQYRFMNRVDPKPTARTVALCRPRHPSSTALSVRSGTRSQSARER